MAKQNFNDPDLRTPAHDAIMMWLDEHAEEVMWNHVIQRKFLEAKQFAAHALASANKPTRTLDEYRVSMESERPEMKVATEWEKPVGVRYGPERFIDLMIAASAVFPAVDLDDVEVVKVVSDRPMYGCDERNEYSKSVGVGFSHSDYSYLRAGVFEHTFTRQVATAYSVTRDYRLACEVKPVIRSIGDLIRQLRNYENRKWRVAVVSPDDRFREIIERQGFIFIKAPQPEYGPQGGLF